MEDVNRLNGDALSAQGADLLRRLRAIEADSADANADEGSDVQAHRDSRSAVRLCIPHFGIIKITCEGIISKEKLPKPPQPTRRVTNPILAQPVLGSSAASLDDLTHFQTGACPAFGLDNPSMVSPAGGIMLAEDAGRGCSDLPGSGAQISKSSAQSSTVPLNSIALEGSIIDPDVAAGTFLQQQYEHPLLIAGVDDWAFQGVDTAFFDSLIRGAINDGSGGTE